MPEPSSKPSPDPSFDDHVATVRRFNRFYTRQIGLLEEGLLQSPFSLAEARVLYELAHRDGLTATDLGRDLGLDAGYLSRMLRSFADRGEIVRTPSQDDARQSLIALTPVGRSAFAPLDTRSRAEIGAMLAELDAGAQRRLVAAMRTIEGLLGERAAERPPYLLRPHGPGDMGWITMAHGRLYAEEYGWDTTFEALVAEIVARFIGTFDPAREHCWIAEIDGEPVGSVFVVRKTDEIAKLRLLLIDPKARGLGIGVRLVDECLRFAREHGYKAMTLWTQSILTAARGIYQRAGFRLVAEEPHDSFGAHLIGETWEREL